MEIMTNKGVIIESLKVSDRIYEDLNSSKTILQDITLIIYNTILVNY